MPSSLINDNYLLVIYAGAEDILTEFLKQAFQMDSTHDRLTRLVAGILWTGHESAMKRCARLDMSEYRLDNIPAVLAECLGVVDKAEGLVCHQIKLQR
ncbi:MAG: hypothetical protein OSB34_12105 [Planktomarina sp.]|nr:hypothetical protein [Planktomarina sp.]